MNSYGLECNKFEPLEMLLNWTVLKAIVLSGVECNAMDNKGLEWEILKILECNEISSS